MHEIRVQPLLVKRAGHNLPTEPMSPSSPISPRTPGTPRFLEDLGSLDPSLYTMVAEVSNSDCFLFLIQIFFQRLSFSAQIAFIKTPTATRLFQTVSTKILVSNPSSSLSN